MVTSGGKRLSRHGRRHRTPTLGRPASIGTVGGAGMSAMTTATCHGPRRCGSCQPTTQSRAEPERQVVDAAEHLMRQRQSGAADIHDGADRALGEGLEHRIGQFALVLIGHVATRVVPVASVTTFSTTLILSSPSAPESLVQHSRTWAPISPRCRRAQRVGVVARRVAAAVRLAAGARIRARLAAAPSASASGAGAAASPPSRYCSAPCSASRSAARSGSAAPAAAFPAAAAPAAA